MMMTRDLHDKRTDSDTPPTRRVGRPDVSATRRRIGEERASEVAPLAGLGSSFAPVAPPTESTWTRGTTELRAVGAPRASHASAGLTRGEFAALVVDVASLTPSGSAAVAMSTEVPEPADVAAVAAAFAAGAAQTAATTSWVTPPPLPDDALPGSRAPNTTGAARRPTLDDWMDDDDPNLRSLRRAAAQLRQTRSRPPTAPNLEIALEESSEEVVLARLAASATAPAVPRIELDLDDLAALIAEVETSR